MCTTKICNSIEINRHLFQCLHMTKYYLAESLFDIDINECNSFLFIRIDLPSVLIASKLMLYLLIENKINYAIITIV